MKFLYILFYLAQQVNLDIGIGNDYKYDRYTKEDTSDGCSVTIYFTERKNK